MTDRLPGFRDFYPEPLPHPDVWSTDAREYLFSQWREVARRYGFRQYDGPPLEALELYTKKSGDEILGQLYRFTDKGEREVALRPEMTPTLARLVAAHERNYKKPIKWFSIPQLFRYERQQKGRLREHFQLNADIIGESDAAADAEIIALLIDTLQALGLTAEDFFIRLSSRQAWAGFLARRSARAEDAYVFYQIIDKIEREEESVTRERLQQIGFDLQEVKDFIGSNEPTPELGAVLENLRARGLSEFVKIDYSVIRGLAYYTGIVFEAFDRQGEFRAIAGGGRYDNLVKLLSDGKVDLPALGFGMGDVVLMELLKARKRLPSFAGGLDVYVLIEDEALRHESLKVIHTLRGGGWAIDYALTALKPDKQIKRAVECGAKHFLRLIRGDGGVMAQIRNLQSREEVNLPLAKVAEHLRGTRASSGG
jgi:histidyl-tRNA synthetase